MIRIEKNTEISSFLSDVWHDPISERPKVDGALCIVCAGVDKKGKDVYDIFPWDKGMNAFDTGVWHNMNEDPEDKHVWIHPEGCTRWCYIEDLLPDTKYLKPYKREDPAKLEKRFWLRSEIYRLCGFPDEKAVVEEIFLWIYDAPIKDWENMLKALDWSCIANGDPKTLQRAKELYNFLR